MKKVLKVVIFILLVFNAGFAMAKEPNNISRIALVSAFEPEINIFLQHIKEPEKTVINGKTFTTGKLAGKDVVLFLSGISIINASVNIQLAIDNFNVSKERTIEICKGIVEKKYNITLLAAAGAFVPSLDEEVLTWLKKAGLSQLRMSIESGNQNVLYNLIKKNIDLSEVKNIVDICKKLGIKTEGAFIFGIPGETIETMNDSLEFAKKAGFDRVIKFIFQPFPNTELHDICIKNSYLTKDYDPSRAYITGNKCYVKTDKFSPEDVLKIVNRQL